MNADGTNPEPARWYTSPDGVQWAFEREANSSSVPGMALYHIVYDPTDPDETAWYKSNLAMLSDPAGVGGMVVSPDGIQWRKVPAGEGIQTSDEQNLSFDRKDHRFIYTVKRFNAHGRAVALATTTDFYARNWCFAPSSPSAFSFRLPAALTLAQPAGRTWASCLARTISIRLSGGRKSGSVSAIALSPSRCAPTQRLSGIPVRCRTSSVTMRAARCCRTGQARCNAARSTR